eukprot:gene29247-35306_t
MSRDSELPVDVQEIIIHGNKRTKTSFFASCLHDTSVISKNSDKTLASYVSDLQKLNAKLLESNLFDSVEGDLQIESRTNGRCKANIVLTVKEKGIPYVHAQSYVRAGEKSDVGFEVQAALRSPLGYGEHLKISSITSASNNREYSAHLHIPNLAGDWTVTGKVGTEQQLSWITYQQALQTVTVDYKPHLASPHRFTAEYSLRNEIPNLPKPSAPLALEDAGGGRLSALLASDYTPASSAVLNSATASLKSSLKHVFTAVDQQQEDHKVFVQTSVELAGGLSSSSAEFLKTDVHAKFERVLGPQLFGQPGLTVSLGGSVGVMYPLGLLVPWLSHHLSSTRPFSSYLSDRYQLGGPLSLRGFAPAGLGPRVAGHTDSLGGDTKTSLLAMVSVPVPHVQLAAANLRAFAFCNLGSLGNSEYWRIQLAGGGLQGKYTPFFGYFRGSVGAGLSLTMGNHARVEATYSFPFLKASHDMTRSFQVGVGVALN